jgi:metal-responsive CopG/Arc/MetJ family transcriptional regulator
MQTTIDIPEEQVAQIDQLSRTRNISRDEIVSRALTVYLESRERALDDSAGAWANSQGDGVQYQQQIRDEWS